MRLNFKLIIAAMSKVISVEDLEGPGGKYTQKYVLVCEENYSCVFPVLNIFGLFHTNLCLHSDLYK